jgi:S-(hydroxymethyl)glutathione dehydrogenase/alcohol dehydrogenase
MRITAAVLPETGAAIDVREVELAAPQAGEVLVRLHASGVCHSDLNAVDGTSATRCPAVLGHEGAGIVEAVGSGVDIKPGTHVALSWMPACNRCEECLRGLTHLCRKAWSGMSHGGLLDGTPRLSSNGAPVYHYSYLSTFAQAAVVPEQCVIPIPESIPFDVAALVGCAVSTGIGAVWNTAGVRPGERVAVMSGRPQPSVGPAHRRRRPRRSRRRPAVASITRSRRPDVPRPCSRPSFPAGRGVLRC